ncbi:DUF721 domain-containing protein [Candidatus Neomarinimicrobiota bacterium]
MNSALKEAGIEKAVAQNRALIVWKKVVGDKIATNTDPVNIRNGVLIVRASSSTWRQELLLKKSSILEKLNKYLKKEIIKDIRFI